MTPERQKWWDSLPAEEKRVRRSIKWQQEIIAYNKAVMNDEFTCDYGYLKKQNREAKHAIKALHKQIAQRPVDNNGIVKCPACREVLCDKDFLEIKTPYCTDCGQNLMWN